MPCPHCQHESPGGARFCIACGGRLAQGCAGCGAELPAGARFCPGCGRPSESPAPAAARQEPEAYTPRHLAEKILTSRSAIQGERKPVTVLFCDLVGSTALAERLGPDGMHALLSRFFNTALAGVHRYEGTINQFLGDGFMALFGAPIAHEDHARRAVLAALGLGRALAEQQEALESGERIDLVVRMGLHTGFVVVGAIGDNLRMDYTAVGDTTHLAARLQQLATPGAIVISDATARLVEGYVALERLGPVEIRGRSAPVTAHRVTGLGPRRSLLDPTGQRTLSRFVGRERELATLTDLVDHAEHGRGHVVGIVGEPGVGKSRILLEVRRGLAGRAVTYLEGRCLSYGSAIPYLPVLDLLRAQCGLADVDTPEATVDKVCRALGELRMDVEARAPYLLQLLGVKEPVDRLAAPGAEVIKARTFETLRQMSRRQSHRCPLVLVVEDLHWIDETSDAYLASLVESLSGAAILLLCTYRPGYRPGWMDKSYATQLSLSPLAAQDSLAVVRSVLPDVRATDAVARLILDRAEGNPFFIEELARVVADDRGAHAGLTLPDTVHGVLTARIDRLPETPKRVLQTASILGREFSVRLLAAVWDAPDALEPHLVELTRLEFLHERTDLDEPVYVFKHALTQEVAEATLVKPRRRELHRRAAAALEALDPDRGRELAPVLAHHYYEAEAWVSAVEHAQRAAETARGAHANREALTRYDQALAAAERAGLPPLEQVALLEARADVHAVLGAFDPAREDLEMALAVAEAARDVIARARVLGALGGLWGGHKDYQKGLELAQQAVALIETQGDRAALAEARARLGIMHLNLARMRDSRRELEQALALFRELRDEAGQARTLEMLAMGTWLVGDITRCLEYAGEAVRRLETVGDRATVSSALVTAGAAHAYRSGWGAGEPWFRRAIEEAIAIGARGGESYARGALAECAVLFGAYAVAYREATTALEIAREIGHREWSVLALSALGHVHAECGDLEGARRLRDEMLATARELGTALWMASALGDLGEDLMVAGDHEAAAQHLAEAIQVGGEATKHVSRALLHLAELGLRRGRADEAVEAARRFQQTDPEMLIFIAEARRIEGDALALLGRTDEAEALLRRAKADADLLQAAAPGWRARLALARLLRASGRSVEAAAETLEALEALEAARAALPEPELRRHLGESAAMREARGADPATGDDEPGLPGLPRLRRLKT